MLAFIIRRLLQGILVMLAVAFVSFIIFRYMGDPISSMLPLAATAQQRQELRQSLHLDDPFVEQFFRFLANVCRGNFGISYRERLPVIDLILRRFPATFELAVIGTVISVVVGIALGVYSALHRKSIGSQVLQVISLLGISVPLFITGIFMIVIFSIVLHLLPPFGRGSVVRIGNWTTGLLTISGIRSLVMPVVMVSVFQVTMSMRLVRAEMIEVMRADFIRFAKARGLTSRAINFGHALRNALLPIITMTGLQIGFTLAFAVVTETVFQWPGMGLLLMQSITFVDVPVIAAFLFLISLLYIIINTIVDLLYLAVDPRLRVAASGSARSLG